MSAHHFITNRHRGIASRTSSIIANKVNRSRSIITNRHRCCRSRSIITNRHRGIASRARSIIRSRSTIANKITFTNSPTDYFFDVFSVHPFFQYSQTCVNHDRRSIQRGVAGQLTRITNRQHVLTKNKITFTKSPTDYLFDLFSVYPLFQYSQARINHDRRQRTERRHRLLIPHRLTLEAFQYSQTFRHDR